MSKQPSILSILYSRDRGFTVTAILRYSANYTFLLAQPFSGKKMSYSGCNLKLCDLQLTQTRFQRYSECLLLVKPRQSHDRQFLVKLFRVRHELQSQHVNTRNPFHSRYRLAGSSANGGIDEPSAELYGS